MEEINKTPEQNHSCGCGKCTSTMGQWHHHRPMRVLFYAAILVIVFSAGCAFGRMHAGRSGRFGHGMMQYGYGGGYGRNMMYERYGTVQQIIPPQAGTTRVMYQNGAWATDQTDTPNAPAPAPGTLPTGQQ